MSRCHIAKEKARRTRRAEGTDVRHIVLLVQQDAVVDYSLEAERRNNVDDGVSTPVPEPVTDGGVREGDVFGSDDAL